MRKIQLAPTATLFHADCRDAMASMADNSIDSIVTDPPYGLQFMGKEWDNTGIANDPALWAEVFRVLKPGGHCAAFSASRTYHRMACAIEDAGFEIRDSLMWVYGTGFPKSQDVSKFIDKMAGAEREIIGVSSVTGARKGSSFDDGCKGNKRSFQNDEVVQNYKTAPATAAAKEWEGWGTALKPAFEPIVLARKPLSEPTVAANVLRWRTGALNIDASRVPTAESLNGGAYAKSGGRETLAGDERNGAAAGMFQAGKTAETDFVQPEGRWPANVVHDGSDEVVGAFPVGHGRGNKGVQERDITAAFEGGWKTADSGERYTHDNGGSAARFFYSAKASKADRNGSKHPTVKPISLMEWLCTLITPPGGTILDPFGGSGTTAIAASNKGFPVILCEREAEYIADIQNRFGPVGPALPSTAALARFHAWNAKALELQAFLDSRVRQMA